MPGLSEARLRTILVETLASTLAFVIGRLFGVLWPVLVLASPVLERWERWEREKSRKEGVQRGCPDPPERLPVTGTPHERLRVLESWSLRYDDWDVRTEVEALKVIFVQQKDWRSAARAQDCMVEHYSYCNEKWRMKECAEEGRRLAEMAEDAEYLARFDERAREEPGENEGVGAIAAAHLVVLGLIGFAVGSVVGAVWAVVAVAAVYSAVGMLVLSFQ